MKIGTDGVLLGAWASIKNDPKSILDIGAGTGILSLMLAQRSLAENIEAVLIKHCPSLKIATALFRSEVWRVRFSTVSKTTR